MRKGVKGRVAFVPPEDLQPEPLGGVSDARYLIFPQYQGARVPRLTQMSRAEAVFALHELCFNLFGCDRAALDVLTDVVRDARCYRLEIGDLAATCDELCQLVEAGDYAERRIA